jgi:hypothetical protein
MTSQQWITVVLALIGIVANLGWFLLARLVKTQDELKQALTGPEGAIARIHARIDKLGETYQTREATEMQFEHLREFMDHWRQDSERRHRETIGQLGNIKTEQKSESDTIKNDVRELRQLINQHREQ